MSPSIMGGFDVKWEGLKLFYVFPIKGLHDKKVLKASNPPTTLPNQIRVDSGNSP